MQGAEHNRGLIWIVSFLCLHGCGAGSPVRVQVSQVPAGTVFLQALVTLNQLAAHEVPTVPVTGLTDDKQYDFVLSLPAGAEGAVQVGVAAADSGGCLLATGVGQASVSQPSTASPTQIDVQLAPVGPQCSGKRPSIWGVLPMSAPAGFLNSLTLRGWGFAPGAAVGVDGQAAMVSSVSPIEIQASTAQSSTCGLVAGCPVEVRVINPDGSQDARSDLFAYSAAPTGLSLADHWRWENPLPQGNRVSGVFGFSADDVWAAVRTNVLLHWNGTAWSSMKVTADTNVAFSAVWGSGPKDVWAAGGGLAHWDGTAWSVKVPFGVLNGFPLYTLWGNAEHVWAAGAGGKILRYDVGDDLGAWNPVNSGTASDLYGLWTDASADAWAVGDKGTILRWDGNAWLPSESGTVADLRGVWGADKDNVWAVGISGTDNSETILRWQDGGWKRAIAQADNVELQSVWGLAKDDVWAVGEGGVSYHWDGKAWSQLHSGTDKRLYGVWGSGKQDIWSVGEWGALLRWNGAAWVLFSKGPTATLKSLWGSSQDDLWAVSDEGSILHRDPSSWALVKQDAANSALKAVWGSSKSDVWAAGAGGTLIHWDGVRWGPVKSSTQKDLCALWGSSQNDVWAAGGACLQGDPKGILLHYDGTAWAAAGPATLGPLQALWGSGKDDVWAAGTDTGQGFVLHYQNMAWTPTMPVGDATILQALWGSGPNDIWAAGDGIWHTVDGKTWKPENRTTGYSGIWGSGPEDIWFVGAVGVHWSNTFTSTDQGSHGLNSLFGLDMNTLWAVGDGGAILRYHP